MNTLKSKLVLVFCLFFVCWNVAAVSPLDPSDDFYTDAYRWETKGYVRDLPDIRPFTPEVIRYILDSVMECGESREVARAEKYLAELDKQAVIYGQGNINTDISDDGKIIALSGNAGLEGRVELVDNLSVAYDLGLNASRGKFSKTIPVYYSSPFDTAEDPLHLLGFEVNLNMNDIVSYGNDSFYFQAGISRSSFGGFPLSSVVYDSTTSHAPHIGFGLRTDRFTYEQQLYALSASNNYGKENFTGKYLMLHSVKMPLNDMFTLQYYETMVYGGRLDLAYLIPAPFMVSQAFSSFGDNLQMGITLDYKNRNGLDIAGNIYIDDLSANDLCKLKFDTKLVFAGQLITTYVPENSVCSLIYGEGLIVAPRMYAHSDVAVQNDGTYHYSAGNDVNYQNYTHNGESIGTKVWPNSFGLRVGTQFDLTPEFSLSLGARYTCHANINESIETDQAIKYLNAGNDDNPQNCKTDGSVLNFPGFPRNNNINKYPDSYTDHFPFMEQQTKMHIFQLSCDLKYSFSLTKKLTCEIGLSDVFEFVKNNGVQNAIFNPLGIAAGEAEVEAALDSWRSRLNDVTNNYATISVKLKF